MVDNCCCLGSWRSAAAEDTQLSSLAQSTHKVDTRTEATASDEASAACVDPAAAGLDTSSEVW